MNYSNQLKTIHGRPPIHKDITKNEKKILNNFFFTAMVENFMEFSRKTSWHGFRHIFKEKEPNESKWWKCWRIFNLCLWTAAIACLIFFDIYMMLLVWRRYRKLPTITTVESNNYPIYNVPFPGVTICNVNVVYKPHTENITIELVNRGFDKETVVSFFQSLARLINFRYMQQGYLQIFAVLEEMGYTTDSLMMQLQHPCEKLLRHCDWMRRRVPCESMFKISKTERGLCCSFNYRQDISENQLVKMAGSGEDVGLRVLVNVETHNYSAPLKLLYGVDILIHDSKDYPQMQQATVVGQPEMEISLAVIPRIIVADTAIRPLGVKQRNCLFKDEKKLRISRVYTFESCMVECREKTILKLCNCVPFFMPDLRYSMDDFAERTCNLRDAKCLSDNKHIFGGLKPPEDVDVRDYFNKSLEGMECECLPNCEELEYDVEAFVTKRNTERIGISTFGDDVDMTNLTMIKVFFQDLSCIKYRRDVYMSWDGLLASFGGIFGLCLGGSVVSIIEFLYFAIIKFYPKLGVNKKKIEEHQRIISAQNYFARMGTLQMVSNARPKIGRNSNFMR